MREMKLDTSLENEQLLARMQQSESCYQLRDCWYRAISALAEGAITIWPDIVRKYGMPFYS